MQAKNDYRTLIRIKGLLTEEEQRKVIPKLVQLAKEEVAKEKLNILLSPAFTPMPIVSNLKNLQRLERNYKEPEGRWYNHDTQEMENHSNKRHIPEYY